MRWNCKVLSSNKTLTVAGFGSLVSLFHKPGDPPSVNRINVRVSGFKVELLPSKGFSVGQAYHDGWPLFWTPPIGICDPESLNLFSKEVAVNGKPAKGYTFLKTFCGGIEFYGLRNWGMPIIDRKTNFHHPIHGEISNIPVDYCDVEINTGEVILSSSFLYRDITAEPGELWYQQGTALFEVKRKVIIGKQNPRLQLFDQVKNVSSVRLKPDWGYHVTFHPTAGSRLLVPSASVENRAGDRVPVNFESWAPANIPKKREETGIIHKGLKTTKNENGETACALLVHPENVGFKISFPRSPYFQTWFCKGGANSEEFTWVSDGKPLFRNNWDGIGIEFGSSALDHDGNTDPCVPEQIVINPGLSIGNYLKVDIVEGKELQLLSEGIQKFNIERRILSKV